jgi:hypothetical protein
MTAGVLCITETVAGVLSKVVSAPVRDADSYAGIVDTECAARH